MNERSDERKRGRARLVVELFGSDANGRKMIAWGRRIGLVVSPGRGKPRRRALAIRRAKRATTVAAPARSGGASGGRVAMELVDNPAGLRAINPAD